MSIRGNFDPTLKQLSPTGSQFRPTWHQLGVNARHLDPKLSSKNNEQSLFFIAFRISFKKSAFMQFWDPLEATLDQLRIKFCKFGPKMDPTGAILGPFSANLGPTWACLAPSWRLFGRSLIHFGAHGGCKHGFVQL